MASNSESGSGSPSPVSLASLEKLAVKSLKDVEDSIDFRLSKSSRPSAEQLDEGLSRQLSDLVHGGHQHRDIEKQAPPVEPLYVITFASYIVSNWKFSF